MAHHSSSPTPWFTFLLGALLMGLAVVTWSVITTRALNLSPSIPSFHAPLSRPLPPGLPTGPSTPSTPTR